MPVLLCLSEQMQLRARAVSFPKHIGTQRLCHRYSGAPSASPRISHAGTPYRAAPYWRWEALYTRVPLPEKQAKAWTTNRFPPARPSPYVVHASACSPPTRAGLYVTSPSLCGHWAAWRDITSCGAISRSHIRLSFLWLHPLDAEQFEYLGLLVVRPCPHTPDRHPLHQQLLLPQAL